MSKQDYILKKHVRADTAKAALDLDSTTPVHEVFLIADKPDKLESAVGFHRVETEDYD